MDERTAEDCGWYWVGGGDGGGGGGWGGVNRMEGVRSRLGRHSAIHVLTLFTVKGNPKAAKSFTHP